MAVLVIEGTWEEIERRKAELVGHHLRVTVDPPKKSKPAKAAEAEPSRPAKVLRGYGMFKGLLSSEEFMRQKQEEIAWEDRNVK